MAVFKRDFFKDGEVLFVGYSSNAKSFSRIVFKGFSNAGLRIYPLNPSKTGDYDVKVFQNIAELPKVPQTAYVLLKPENSAKVTKELKDAGVKYVMFQPGSASKETKADCLAMGMEIVEACPLMVFGKGIHRIHGFFAGLGK